MHVELIDTTISTKYVVGILHTLFHDHLFLSRWSFWFALPFHFNQRKATEQERPGYEEKTMTKIDATDRDSQKGPGDVGKILETVRPSSVEI